MQTTAITTAPAASEALDALKSACAVAAYAGRDAWNFLTKAVLAGNSIEACRATMKETEFNPSTIKVYIGQVRALSDAGRLVEGVSQSEGAEAYKAARKAKRDAKATDAKATDAEAPAAVTTAEPKDMIVLSGGLTTAMLPDAIEGVIYLDPAACAAMLRAIGWTVHAPGEAPTQASPKAPTRSRKKAVTA